MSMIAYAYFVQSEIRRFQLTNYW